MSFKLFWRLGGSVEFLINLFGFFELTMVVVRGREDAWEHQWLRGLAPGSSRYAP